jgi:hypothetical protein
MFFSLYASNIDSVIARSDSCVQIEWVPDSLNTSSTWYLAYGQSCTGADSVFRKCDFLSGLTYRGIAYSYGGEDPWYLFRNKLNLGFPAGSHQCHYYLYGDPSDTIAGTDCSGFLSFVWNYPRSSTRMFYSSPDFETISFSQLKPGDALVTASPDCGYHAILVIESESLSETVIAEASSSVFGCRERVIDLNQPYWNCYKALRYPKHIPTNQKKKILYTDKIPLTIKTLKSNKHYRISFSLPFSGSANLYNAMGKRIIQKRVTSSKSIIFPYEISSKIAILRLVTENGITRSLIIPFF